MPVELGFSVTVDDPLLSGATEISIEATVTAPGGDTNPSNNEAMETTPIVLPPEVFDDDFESGDTSAWSATVP